MHETGQLWDTEVCDDEGNACCPLSCRSAPLITGIQGWGTVVSDGLISLEKPEIWVWVWLKAPAGQTTHVCGPLVCNLCNFCNLCLSWKYTGHFGSFTVEKASFGNIQYSDLPQCKHCQAKFAVHNWWSFEGIVYSESGQLDLDFEWRNKTWADFRFLCPQ